ncbi:hypothetical protein FB567DRAFT_545506 [Paraphoma chrysanthemicola]|uniref:Uncharacterized protein n=1 Tax=Paraphoma chrysanthemicola TaxID=798071 RepID=A0A8K0W2T1_9PLEO|nr:hypothetical protein FB567DRAFT_545506 [Paraphoma chrysanthemicola]
MDTTKVTNGGAMVRIVFTTNGIAYTHLVHVSRLQTSKYLTNNLRAYAGKHMPVLRVTFNYRAVTAIWYHWVYHRQIKSKRELVAHPNFQDSRSTDRRALEEYLDLLACVCLGQVIGDVDFSNAALAHLVDKIDNSSNKAILVKCFTPPVVRDIFSLFDATSSVREVIINAMVLFGPVDDIRCLTKCKGYPSDYISGVFLQSFQQMVCIRDGCFRGNGATETTKPATPKESSLIRALRGGMTIQYGNGPVIHVPRPARFQ